jgi:hypothetical protein
MSNPGPASTVTSNSQNLNTQSGRRFLAVVKGVNVNATGDTPLPLIISSTASYSVTNVVFTNASISLTTALAGVFTAPAAGGTAIVANAALSGLTGPTVVSARTVASTAVVTNTGPLYLNVGTAQGAAATMDVYVEGYDFS